MVLWITYAFFFGPGWSALLSPIRRFVEVEPEAGVDVEAEMEGASFSFKLPILVAMELTNEEVNEIKVNGLDFGKSETFGEI